MQFLLTAMWMVMISIYYLSQKSKRATSLEVAKRRFCRKGKCTQCGKCREICRFNAIDESIGVDFVSCEGCAFCSFACPVRAIEMRENASGEWFISDTRFGPLVHAKLGVDEENSGKLASLVRKKAKELAEQNKGDWVIVDGTPGIACP